MKTITNFDRLQTVDNIKRLSVFIVVFSSCRIRRTLNCECILISEWVKKKKVI